MKGRHWMTLSNKYQMLTSIKCESIRNVSCLLLICYLIGHHPYISRTNDLKGWCQTLVANMCQILASNERGLIKNFR